MRVGLPSIGCLVLVVGPSGAGKDTLLDFARERLSSDQSFRFVRRVITRPAAAGEDHEPVIAQEFERRASADAFALQWRAHGLRYGLPAMVTDWIDEGYVVVTNGSRGVIREAQSRLPAVHVVTITAPQSMLAARLVARGRESSTLIVDRLARADAFGPDEFEPDGCAAYEIDNSRSPQEGGAALVRILRSIKALGR
jgi:ribose 1,5-bisphosphokinase